MGRGFQMAVLSVACLSATADAQQSGYLASTCASGGPTLVSEAMSSNRALSVSAGELLVVAVGYLDAGGTISVSDSLGHAFVDLGGIVSGPTPNRAGVTGRMFYSVAADAGPDLFTASWDAAQPGGEIFVGLYSLGGPLTTADATQVQGSTLLDDAGFSLTPPVQVPGTLLVAYALASTPVHALDGGMSSREFCDSDLLADRVATSTLTSDLEFEVDFAAPYLAIAGRFQAAVADGGPGSSGPPGSSGMTANLGCGCATGDTPVALLTGVVLLAARRHAKKISLLA